MGRRPPPSRSAGRPGRRHVPGRLLDARPEHAEDTYAAMRAAGLPEAWQTRLVPHDDGVLGGHRVVIEGPRMLPAGHPRGSPTSARACSGAARSAGARARPRSSPASPRPRPRSTAWRRRGALPRARGLGLGRRHRRRRLALEALAPSGWSVRPLPLGRGGSTPPRPLPVPAPAAALCSGLAMVDDGIAGERVTPTGPRSSGIWRRRRIPPGAVAPRSARATASAPGACPA